MEKKPIHLPGSIPAKQWKLKIPDDLGSEYDDMRSYDDYKIRLEKLGFKMLFETESLSLNSIKKNYSLSCPEFHSLWHHEVGLIVDLDSYTTGGWVKEDGTYEPVARKLNSATVNSVIDFGMGGEVQHRSACKMTGYGGVRVNLDGSQAQVGWEPFHSNTGSTLTEYLKRVQSYGKFVPVEKWTQYGGDLPFLDNELIAPLLPEEEPSDFHKLLFSDNSEGIRDEVNKKFEELFSGLQAPLGQALTDLLRSDSKKSNVMRWDGVEAGLKHYSEALFLSKKRWPKDPEKELLGHWASVALGEVSDQSKWRESEQGPAGLNLAGILTSGKPHTGSSERLLYLVQTVDEKLLKKWCSEPDAAGFTLPLLLLRRLLNNNDTYVTAGAPEDTLTKEIFPVLARRLGVENLNVNTDKRSVLGLVLDFDPGVSSNSDMRRLVFGHGRFADAIEVLDRVGIQWREDLKWRTYPNIMTEKEKPTFFSIPGPVSEAQFKELVGYRWTDQLESVYVSLRRNRLNEVARIIRHKSEESAGRAYSNPNPKI